jgi:deoxyhypusine synthase
MTQGQGTTAGKVAGLSEGLRGQIAPEGWEYEPGPDTPVSNHIVRTMRHCNAGSLVEAGLWLKRHCAKGGQLFVTLAGAASSFQIGVVLCDLIRAGLVSAISATGANMEESLYRFVANGHYARISRYKKLTPEQELELDHAGLRRITDTFLPEEESVRVVLEHLMALWYEAADKGEEHHWHEYFFQLFERGLIQPDPTANPEECWLYMAWKHGVRVIVPGWEDSTMGNIFTHATYRRKHQVLGAYALERPVNRLVVRPTYEYMHDLAEWYVGITQGGVDLAFVQLGGGIAGDFPICVVPHLKHDYLHGQSIEVQEATVKPWAGFVELHVTPMSCGSYSGAGGDEKITWSKLTPESYKAQVFGDFTISFPLLAALILSR